MRGEKKRIEDNVYGGDIYASLATSNLKKGWDGQHGDKWLLKKIG